MRRIDLDLPYAKLVWDDTLIEQRGFFGLPGLGITSYAMIGLCVALIAMSIALKVQTSRLHSLQETHAAFVAKVEALGNEAKHEAAVQTAADIRNKERSDEEHTRISALHAAELQRLRDANTSRSFVPAAAPGAVRPDLACFDRAELDGAIRRFAAGAIELTGKGEQAVIDLDTAKHWARP